VQSSEYPDLQFVEPNAWGSGRDGNSVQYIVVHYTAGSERSTSAEDGAAYDARRTDGTSTHYFVDSDSVVQCVYTWNRANAAFSIGNRRGIQYELCGTQQTRAQWLDPASDATITRAARQMARDCIKYGLPIRKLTPAQMNAGWKGICGHADVTLAYGLGDHMDPGVEFPYDVLLARIDQIVNPPAPVAPSSNQAEGEDMTKFYFFTAAAGSQPAHWGFGFVCADGSRQWLEADTEAEATGYALGVGLSATVLSQTAYASTKAKFTV
jgi:hypothetical protein